MAADLLSTVNRREETLLVGIAFVIIVLGIGTVRFWGTCPERDLEGLGHFLSLQLRLLVGLGIVFTIYYRLRPETVFFIYLRHASVLFLATAALIIAIYCLVKVYTYNDSKNSCVGWQFHPPRKMGFPLICGTKKRLTSSLPM